MTGHTTFFDLVTLYIDIVPSNLSASINGETNDVTGSSEMEFNFNQVLTLNALDFSTDPDVDPAADQGLAFYWYCRKEDESYPSSVPEILQDGPPSEQVFSGCFGVEGQANDEGRLVSGSNGIASVETSLMEPSQVYVFDVIVTKDDREARATLVVDLLPAAAPDVEIT